MGAGGQGGRGGGGGAEKEEAASLKDLERCGMWIVGAVRGRIGRGMRSRSEVRMSGIGSKGNQRWNLVR